MNAWTPGGTVLNEFYFERALGEGGFGTVALLRNRLSGERFAVKRTLITDPVGRAQFLMEMRNWTNLPTHPHLVGFRFFRTVGEEVALFAEYVPGGSLHDWLRDGRLYKGGTKAAQARAIDIGIQQPGACTPATREGSYIGRQAWNVRTDRRWQAKIADFGLAAGRHQASSAFEEDQVLEYLIQDIPDDPSDRRELLKAKLREVMDGKMEQAEHSTVFPGGKQYTLAYASPEQVEGREMNRRTDVWSWGVTVLEMFIGQRTWPSGTLADAILDDVLDDVASKGKIALPLGGDIVEVLRRCFRDQTSERWPSMDQAAQALQQAYRTATGQNFRVRRPRTRITRTSRQSSTRGDM